MTAGRLRAAVTLAAVLAIVLTACAGDDAPAGPGLLFVSSRDGDYAIYTMSGAGGDEERLTEAKADPSSPRGLFFQIEPAWSPDGETIAFASKRRGTFDIYAMTADGSETRRLTSTKADDGHPSWSPDGGRIVFERGTPGDLYVMNADGSDVQAIADAGAAETQPAWSPDGRWIAYVQRQPGTTSRELWLVRPNGTGSRRLTSLAAVSYSPAWSPESSRVAFSTNRVGQQFDIYSIGTDGTKLRQITETAADSFEPAWSPDGERIAFAEGGSISVVELGGGEPRELTDPADNDSSPVWLAEPGGQ